MTLLFPPNTGGVVPSAVPDIGAAVKGLKAGGKWKRSGWGTNKYLHLVNGVIRVHNSTTDKVWTCPQADILADDWKVA